MPDHINFFSRHRKILFEYATAPAIILVGLGACFVFFRPAQVSWHQFLNYFFSSPLGMGLELVVVITMLVYLIYHCFYPVTPKQRAIFVGTALFAGLVVNGIYNERLSQTIDFTSSSGTTQFFAGAFVFYCLYRLVILAPERERKWVTVLFVAALLFHLLSGGHDVYKKAAAGFPCSASENTDLWYAIVYKNPQQHCTIK